MHDTHDIDDLDEEFSGPSKSAVKRQMTALQELGESLTKLSKKQLANVPIDDERLIEAVLETHRISSKNARKRHMQFIGKLMREVDSDAISAAMEAMYRHKQESDYKFHGLEILRDKILEQGPSGIEQVVERWPNADRQQLRQLILQHQREIKNSKPPAASRKLFKYLRQLQESEPESS